MYSCPYKIVLDLKIRSESNWRRLLGSSLYNLVPWNQEAFFPASVLTLGDSGCIFIVTSVLIMIQGFKTCVHNFCRCSL